MVDGECGEPSGRFSHRHPVDRNMSSAIDGDRDILLNSVSYPIAIAYSDNSY